MEAGLYPAAMAIAAMNVRPDWAAVHRELRWAGVMLQLLWAMPAEGPAITHDKIRGVVAAHLVVTSSNLLRGSATSVRRRIHPSASESELSKWLGTKVRCIE
ncbi:MAG: hypothetical protein WBW73_23775 [Rhodoplanes sp.]